jgi:signal transduction histidine kinase
VTRWFSTLRGQFVAITAAAVIVSNLVVALGFDLFHERELSGERNASLVARVSAVTDLVSSLPERQHTQALRAVSSLFLHYTIVGAPPKSSPMGDDEAALALQIKTAEQTARPQDVRVHRFSELGGHHPRDVTEVAQSLAAGRWLIARYERRIPPEPHGMLIAGLAAALLTGAAAAWIAGRVSRPLSALASAADDVARGRNAPPLDAHGPDDIKRAAVAFNTMTERVGRTLESHRQLLSAVGHDLRTPISAMRINAEFVQDSEVRDRLVRSLDELQSLTEAVLAAARATPGEESRRIDFAALIESVGADLVDLGNPIEMQIEGTAPCMCRPNELRRALRNLIENAVRYGAPVRVSLEIDAGNYTAVIDDNGPGIPPDQLERVFEPFVRLEASRNSATGGAGLGLTLARTIAREHGGDVTLENRAGGGLRAKLILPREKQS